MSRSRRKCRWNTQLPAVEGPYRAGRRCSGTSGVEGCGGEADEDVQRETVGIAAAAPSAGCIFKNPGTIPAGKLIDELG